MFWLGQVGPTWARSGVARHAHLDGFDLHANVAVRGADREGLEQICRYLLRIGSGSLGRVAWSSSFEFLNRP
jgi:hypothetical protein